MVSFRRFILAIAVLALFTGLASAQVIVGGTGSSGGQLICVANVSNPAQLRAEGHTELVGDIVIQCTGGVFPGTAGTPVPTANITVALSNTYVTSRVFGNQLSEALLLIDEPGATSATGPGAALPIVNCADNAGNKLVGAGPGGCATVVGGAGTVSAVLASGAGAGTVVPNAFQGIVSANQVTFNGVPILAPVTAGLARVFRITNIRASAATLPGSVGPFQAQAQILASISISNGVLITNPVPIVGSVFTGLASTNVRNAANSNGTSGLLGLAQCGTAGLTAGSVLRFNEGFAAAFKTRVAPTAAYSGAATSGSGGAAIANSAFTQNVPGLIYAGSESGFILPVTGGTAGLADFGTRLKATFNNVPSGVNIFVSTTNINPDGNTGVSTSTNTGSLVNAVSNIPVNTTSGLLAGLVLGETAGVTSQGSFLPLQGGTNNSSGVNLFGPLPTDANGTATAVWEILTSNPAQAESAEFAVFYSYSGNPATNTPPLTPGGTVSMSFAPTTSTYNGIGNIPRFAPSATSASFISVEQCTTTLLFPFVNAAPGFDTGIAIANTTSDPFSTKSQAGSCTLNFYGTGAGTTTTSPFPSAGGTIAAGTVNAEQVSNLKSGFMGYVIAVCNFQLAHGYALFSDTGIRNWATGYLALVLPTGTHNRNSGNLTGTIGTTGIEGAGN